MYVCVCVYIYTLRPCLSFTDAPVASDVVLVTLRGGYTGAGGPGGPRLAHVGGGVRGGAEGALR